MNFNWSGVLPWIVLASGILGTLLISVIRVETRKPAQISALVSLALTFGLAMTTEVDLPYGAFGGVFEVSSLTLGVLAFLSLLGILFVVGAESYLDREKLHFSDFYHLLLLLILGASVLVSSKDLLVSFIALEVMSLPAYTLAGFRRNDSRSNEAAIKYFVLGGAMGAVFLLGVSFIYGATGSTLFPVIFSWARTPGVDPTLFVLGQLLVLVAFLFKVAAAPLHFWKPDVYEGAPTPITGVMATIVSTAAFLTLARLVHLVDYHPAEWTQAATWVKGLLRIAAAASLILGSAILITQKNLKRMMAYSAISHSGYLLLGLLGSFGPAGEIHSVMIYLLGYSLMSTGLFVLMSLSKTPLDGGLELVDVTGLYKKSPGHALLWVILLLSMAGMPFTFGFFTKAFVFLSSMDSGETPLVILAALCTVVSAYAYLRIIGLMVMRESDPSAAEWQDSWGSQIVVCISVLVILFLGVNPNGMIHYLKGIPLIH